MISASWKSGILEVLIMIREIFRNKRDVTNQSSELVVLAKSMYILFFFFQCHGKSHSFSIWVNQGKHLWNAFWLPYILGLEHYRDILYVCYFQTTFLDLGIIFQKEFHNGKERLILASIFGTIQSQSICVCGTEVKKKKKPSTLKN